MPLMDKNRGLKETSVEDDMVRIKMMTSRYIDYTKKEDYARELLHKCDLSNSSVVSCLRVCRYYKEYLDERNKFCSLRTKSLGNYLSNA